jgi:hypothetical protein
MYTHLCHSDEAAYSKLLLPGTVVGADRRSDSGGARTSTSTSTSSAAVIAAQQQQQQATVQGYEPQAECLALQVCNEHEYVYVGVL